MRSAFSLVELSIVLVILGLLTGGILAGQNLIRAAELRSVSTQFQNFQTAVMTFRDKYFALPGDMNNATAFWGDDATNCADALVTDGTPGTCNGDGNGQFNAGAGANATGEQFQVWKQLALAGLIEGTYSGLAGSAGSNDHDIGTNEPAGKLGQSSWGFYYNGPISGHATYFDGEYGNTLMLGAAVGSTSNTRNNQPLVSPEEMWNVDTKVDDGKPARGKLVIRNRTRCVLGSDGAALTGSAADAADLDATYDLQNQSVDCVFLFKNF